MGIDVNDGQVDYGRHNKRKLEKDREIVENLVTSSINVSTMVRADQPGRMSNISKLPSH